MEYSLLIESASDAMDTCLIFSETSDIRAIKKMFRNKIFSNIKKNTRIQILNRTFNYYILNEYEEKRFYKIRKHATDIQISGPNMLASFKYMIKHLENEIKSQDKQRGKHYLLGDTGAGVHYISLLYTASRGE